jgi:hypothetical protein
MFFLLYFDLNSHAKSSFLFCFSHGWFSTSTELHALFIVATGILDTCYILILVWFLCLCRNPNPNFFYRLFFLRKCLWFCLVKKFSTIISSKSSLMNFWITIIFYNSLIKFSLKISPKFTFTTLAMCKISSYCDPNISRCIWLALYDF